MAGRLAPKEERREKGSEFSLPLADGESSEGERTGRSRGVGTPLKHAETQNGAGQEAARPRASGKGAHAICAAQEIADPPESRVYR